MLLPTHHLNADLFSVPCIFWCWGFFLGLLAEQQKQLRTEKSVITRVLGRASVEAGLPVHCREFWRIAYMYGASYVVLASQEANSHHIFVSEVRSLNELRRMNWLEPSANDDQTYLLILQGTLAMHAALNRRFLRGFESAGN